MMIKAVTLFLLIMGIAAVVFNFRTTGGRRRVAKPQTCPKCGRHIIGSGPCPCGKPAKKG
ncbi:hypothetical protein [Gemmobacter aquatilis]|uniref:hypothetical protein n=1 Tax=Gemmobacter aquatilis TaxID=933059 RepID=UPI000B81894D|nr:hypothetical protein [Gemmobacter aquatilis]